MPAELQIGYFCLSDSLSSVMEKKDIIILVVVFATIGFSLYRKYMKKKNESSSGSTPRKKSGRSSLKDQADDYEPYSGGNS